MKRRNWIKLWSGLIGIGLIIALVLSLIPVSPTITVSNGILSLGLGTNYASANSDPNWLSGYSDRQEITINGTADGAQTNYQMCLTVNNGTGTSNSSTVYEQGHALSWTGTVPNDTRFTKSDGTTQLTYWIESSNSTTASIWIEFDSIPASPSTANFYIYYGKANDTTT